jgi:hopene-associated glycosyltransferase HpnB
MVVLVLALLVAVIWLGLALAHAGFWRMERTPVPGPPQQWPAVTVVIPARDEEAGISETLRSLWAQDYPERLHIVLVNDHSQDRTVEIARQTAAESGHKSDLRIVEAAALPAGWTGKVWAMQQGVLSGLPPEDPARYVLFSDADISHGSDSVRELVCRAEADGCDLVSFMVRLHCGTGAERLMIPAFVFFFRLLYPFRRVNDPRHPLAGAAGGVMLVRRTALERIGGMECIRGELIDDCALAREIKRGGHRIWLGLSVTSRSTRRYDRLSEIIHMIARTAYTQIRYSLPALMGCVLGLALTFLAPPLLLLFAGGWAAAIGGMVWLLMGLLFLPIVRYYQQSPLWAPLLPLIALLYLGATLLSAWRHMRGQGGQWKGRSQQAK